MDKIINDLNSKINQLNFRLNQLSYSKKNVKFYYSEQIYLVKSEIKDLQAQLIYYKNYNQEYIIDIHGCTKYFVENYLDDLLFYKMEFNKTVELITGKGNYVIFNAVKKYLNNEKLKYKIIDFNFIIHLY